MADILPLLPLRVDAALDPSAWFDDDSTVSQAAEVVLAKLDNLSKATSTAR